MIGNDEGRLATSSHLAAHPAHGARGARERLSCKDADGEDRPGPDEGDLLLKEGCARRHFVAFGIPVFRRPALDHVGDVYGLFPR